MIHKRHMKRFRKEQRVRSIYGRIYESTTRNKPLTIAEIARLEHISKSWAYHYLRIIRKRQRKRGILIKVRRFGKKRFLVYENVAVKEARLVRQQRGAYKLHASTKYSQGPQRGLQIELEILISDSDRATVRRGIAQIGDLLREHNFKGLVDSLDFGVEPATPDSRPFFQYRHDGEAWTKVW
ncbi:MAG: hypothetical protein ACHQ03_10825 [Candidatus Bathyarchaeia archaeon]